MALRKFNGRPALLLLVLWPIVWPIRVWDPVAFLVVTMWSWYMLMLLLCLLLSMKSSPFIAVAEPNVTTPTEAESKPSLIFLSNYPVWVKATVPKLQQVTSRLLVVSNKIELAEWCTEVGCEFMLFPICVDGLSFARICKEDADYRQKVEATYDALRRWSPDFMITAGCHVLPPHAVTIPTRAALNFHPSKLPWYRGGLPFQAQILRGESHLECCIHVMTNIIDDSRDVLVRGGRISLEGKTTDMLFEDIKDFIPNLIMDALNAFNRQSCVPLEVPQVELPHSFGVKAEFLIKNGEKRRSNAGVLSRVRIEWAEDTALEIERASRAFTGPKGFKGMFTDYQGQPVRVTHCAVLPFGPEGHSNAPGTILWTKTGNPTVVSVATVDGTSVLLTLDTEAPVLVGQRLESRTLVSEWLQKPFTDRLEGGQRFA